MAGRRRPTALGVNVAGLTGDVRVLQKNQTAQLIDAEWAEPKVLLVTGQASGGASPSWRLIAGIDRAQLGTFDLQTGTFSRVVLARSVQLSVTNVPLDGITCSAIVVPIDASANVVDILGTNPTAPEGPPNYGEPSKFAVSTVAVSFGNLYPAGNPLALGHFAGATIYNYSPAGRNLYIVLGPFNPIVNDTFTHIIAPGGYYETPFGYNGEIRGIWSGADAAGFAAVTYTGFQS